MTATDLQDQAIRVACAANQATKCYERNEWSDNAETSARFRAAYTELLVYLAHVDHDANPALRPRSQLIAGGDAMRASAECSSTQDA